MIEASRKLSFGHSSLLGRTAMRARSVILVVFVTLLPTTVLAQDASPAASPTASVFTVDTHVDAGGRTLHVACAGSGGPPILIDFGGPYPAGGTDEVAILGPDVSAALGVRFCSYDRAGTGQSPPDPAGVRTMREAGADLNAVLASPELGCPCVVAGVSLGGGIALVALEADPSRFAALVQLDPIYPSYFDDFFALAPADAPETVQWAELARGDNDERLDLITGFREAATPTRPATIPVVVITHGAGDAPPCQDGSCSADFPLAELEAAWQEGEADLAEALGGRLVVAEGTGHAIGDENPGLVIGLAAEVIAAVRDPSTWATPEGSPTA